MKKLILILFIFSALVTPVQEAKAIDAKPKAFMIISAYGTVGGALLGFASMAFGTNSRAIAQGASLGLYAGIIFGAYVIMSHNKGYSGYEEDEYADPYGEQVGPQPSNGGFGNPFGGSPEPAAPAPGGFGAPAPADDQGGGGFFGQRINQINNDLHYNYKLKNKKGRAIAPPIYIPVFYSRF